MAERLKGRVAIVTGGGQGLGEAICRRLVAEGSAVAVADVNEAAAARVAEELRAQGRAVAVRADVTNEAEVAALVQRAEAELGELDLMVANAGILLANEITEFPLADWQRVLEVNLTGYFLCAREAARVMVPRGRGVILQINSKSGKKGSFRNSAYAASKFGGIGLTQSIALDLAPYGIRVVGLVPGLIAAADAPPEALARTAATVPLGRAGASEDLAGPAVFLASDDAAYVTGSFVTVDGGVLFQQRSPQVETFPLERFPSAP
jgi:sorbitol-6-phosphate 2-dehydrogenase